MKPKIHYRNLRLAVNAEMNFPDCYSRPSKELLDTDKGRLKTTGNKDQVTCVKCRKALGFKRSW